MNHLELIVTGIFIIALLYSSIGHGGASGYLAVMALCGVTPEIMRTQALVLNLFVAGIAFLMFYKTGNFRMRLFLPFAITSVPAAFISSHWTVNPHVYKVILGICLMIALGRIMIKPAAKEIPTGQAPVALSLLIGLSLGTLAGMIGIGGGIILSPLLILLGWANVKQAAGISALFIWVNSLSGLFGILHQGFYPDSSTLLLIVVALAGGTIGSFMGSHRISLAGLRYLLGFVLCFAAVKLIFL